MHRTDGGGESLAQRIAALAGGEVLELRGAGAQHGVRHVAVSLAGGREAFAKVSDRDQRPAFEAEARGLLWLAEASAAPVPEVFGWDERALVLAWVPPG